MRRLIQDNKVARIIMRRSMFNNQPYQQCVRIVEDTGKSSNESICQDKFVQLNPSNSIAICMIIAVPDQFMQVGKRCLVDKGRE